MNILNEKIIRENISDKFSDIEIYIYNTIDSTNDEAKRYWKGNRKYPCLFVSEEQSGGRGRRGRSFYSPKGTGIYMSLLIRPKIGLEDSVHITTATAVVVAESIQRLTGKEVGIKWVNDIYFQNKKVCGILTEAIMEPDMTGAPAVVVGIGINLSTEQFPKELEGVATRIGAGSINLRNELIAEITNGLLEFAENVKDCSYVDRYRKLSIVLGKEIYYSEGNTQVRARALDVDSEGGLMVECEDGTVKILKTGEITVRLCD